MSNSITVGQAVNNATVVALPTGTGLFGEMYQLQRLDGSLFYDFIDAQLDDDVERVALTLDGFNVNPSNPIPVSFNNQALSMTNPMPVQSAQFKNTRILTTAAIANNATYTSPWFDSYLDGALFIQAILYISSGSITYPQWQIQETDDNTDPNVFHSVATAGAYAITPPSNAPIGSYGPNVLNATVKARYWRIQVQNTSGATISEMKITATTTNEGALSTLYDPSSGLTAQVVTGNGDGQSQYDTGILSMGNMFGFNRSNYSWDRVLTTAIGTDPGSGARGSFVVSGSLSATPVPTVPTNAAGLNAVQPTSYAAVAAGKTTATVVKSSAGRCFDIIITTVGTGALQITDGVSGAVIAEVPASAAVGRYPFNSPANSSINCAGGSTLPAFTILYS